MEAIDVRQHVLDRLSAGEYLTAICAGPGMPGRQVVLRWALEEGWRDDYASARKAGIDARVEQMHSIAALEEDVNRAKLLISVTQWEASKLHPERYGDRTALQMLDETGKPAKAGITIIIDGAPGSKRVE